MHAVGIEADSERVDALIAELEGKDIAEVIAAGASKLASVPAGGGVAMAASGGASLSRWPAAGEILPCCLRWIPSVALLRAARAGSECVR